MRDADHAHPCGRGSVPALPGITRCYAMQRRATAPLLRQNEPTVPSAVNTGLGLLTQVDAGLRESAIWQNEPTVRVSAVTSGPADAYEGG